MSGIYMLLGTLIALGVLVTIHEFGHFWVARRCGVRVERFSVGFGKPLLSWHDRHGTEFVIAALPLGGYVKMLDGREQDLTPEQEQEAFNLKPVGQRMAVVVAGPVANFLLAFVFFWLLAILGTQQVRPVIGEIIPGGLADVAGLMVGQEIVAVDGETVQGWGDINLRLMGRLGETGTLQLEAVQEGNTLATRHEVVLQDWQRGVEEVNPLQALGIEPWRPLTRAVLTHFEEQGPAARAGLRSADEVLAIAGVELSDWSALVREIQQRPDQQVELLVRRDGSELILPVQLGSRKVGGVEQGYLGAGVTGEPWPDSMLVERSFGLLGGALEGVKHTWRMSAMTLASIKKMLLGQLSAKNLSGPISIAKVAGASAESGLRSFLNFMAYLSISLGVLNLLPVPVLDGGHLVFYTLEWVRGKPLSERIQALGMQAGMALILGLMVFAVFNDIARL